MKKIVIISDNHGFDKHIINIKKIEKNVDYYIHCGDHLGNNDLLQGMLAVKGNLDYGSTLPDHIDIEIEGIKFYITHGHQFPHFADTKYLANYAKSKGADVLVYGHTHIQVNFKKDGILLVNPGSTAYPKENREPTYCVLTINDGKIKVQHKEYDF